MSLILDALRKSEAERRRGKAPDLFAPVAANQAPADRPRTAWLLIAIVVVALLAAIAFWPTSPVAEKIAAGAASTMTTPASDPSVPTAIPMAAPAPTTATLPSVAQTPSMPPMPEATPEAMPALPPKPEPLTAPPIAELPIAPEPTPIAADDGAATGEPALPGLADLDSATRTALPPLRLSMHVWNADAALRFAIIDGQRLGEGARLGSAVVVAIRRDGVVLAIDDRQFLLPRP